MRVPRTAGWAPGTRATVRGRAWALAAGSATPSPRGSVHGALHTACMPHKLIGRMGQAGGPRGCGRAGARGIRAAQLRTCLCVSAPPPPRPRARARGPPHLDGGCVGQDRPVHQQQHLAVEVHQAPVDHVPAWVLWLGYHGWGTMVGCYGRSTMAVVSGVSECGTLVARSSGAQVEGPVAGGGRRRSRGAWARARAQGRQAGRQAVQPGLTAGRGTACGCTQALRACARAARCGTPSAQRPLLACAPLPPLRAVCGCPTRSIQGTHRVSGSRTTLASCCRQPSRMTASSSFSRNMLFCAGGVMH